MGCTTMVHLGVRDWLVDWLIDWNLRAAEHTHPTSGWSWILSAFPSLWCTSVCVGISLSSVFFLVKFCVSILKVLCPCKCSFCFHSCISPKETFCSEHVQIRVRATESTTIVWDVTRFGTQFFSEALCSRSASRGCLSTQVVFHLGLREKIWGQKSWGNHLAKPVFGLWLGIQIDCDDTCTYEYIFVTFSHIQWGIHCSCNRVDQTNLASSFARGGRKFEYCTLQCRSMFANQEQKTSWLAWKVPVRSTHWSERACVGTRTCLNACARARFYAGAVQLANLGALTRIILSGVLLSKFWCWESSHQELQNGRWRRTHISAGSFLS